MLRPLAGEPAGTRRRRMVRTVEQSAMRKVYLRILPFAVLTYFFCYLDRINVGFAALTMNKDLGLDAAIYGMAAGAFFWGYVLFEVPSNIILEKVGARLWIARIMITWGIISGATAFATGPYSSWRYAFRWVSPKRACSPALCSISPTGSPTSTAPGSTPASPWPCRSRWRAAPQSRRRCWGSTAFGA